jgi:HAD superfamily hydrolase (TIGR01509 family)
VLRFTDLPLRQTRVLLCDADGNLFPSEEPAFVASAEVTNRFLRAFGVDGRFTPEELRLATTGKNFRTTAVELAAAQGVPLGPGLAPPGGRSLGGPASAGRGMRPLTVPDLEHWVAEEKERVTAHLRTVLRPDPRVVEPLTRLSRRFDLALVSSSARSRLDASLSAAGLAHLFPEARRFSAEDSLPTPTSKPDPAIYAWAGARLGVAAAEALAIEDSVPGARSAVAAGFPTLGNVCFVRSAERPARIAALESVGVAGVAASWAEIVALCLDGAASASRAAAKHRDASA